MADTASWPWLEWVGSHHPSHIIRDVCDQLHIQHPVRGDFLRLMWWHTHENYIEHHLQSLPHRHTLPPQLQPTIESFLQRYGSSLWPDTDILFPNRDHLLTTSRYSSAGYYGAPLQNSIPAQPFMSLHGRTSTGFQGDEPQDLAFSSLGRLLQVLLLAMLKLRLGTPTEFAARAGNVDQALLSVLGMNVNNNRQAEPILHGTNPVGQFPAIEDGSRPSDRDQQEFGLPVASQQQQQQGIVRPDVVTNHWPHQHQPQGQQQQYVRPDVVTNHGPHQHQAQEQQQQMAGTVVPSRYVSIAPAPHLQSRFQPSGYSAYAQPQPQPGQQQQQVQYQDHSVPMLQPPPTGARTYSRRRRVGQRAEIASRRGRADGGGQI